MKTKECCMCIQGEGGSQKHGKSSLDEDVKKEIKITTAVYLQNDDNENCLPKLKGYGQISNQK